MKVWTAILLLAACALLLAQVPAVNSGTATYPTSGTICTTTSCPSGGAMVYSGTSLTLTAGTRYFPIGGGGTPSTTETDVDVEAPAAATITNFYAQLSVTLGAGQTATFTWRKAGADQSVTCQISGTATTCNDTTHSFAVAQGDLIDIKLVTTGTVVATPNLVMAVQFGTTGSNGTVNTGTTGQIGYFAANGTAISGETLIKNNNYYGTLCPGSTTFVATDQTTTSTAFVDLATADTCTFTLVAVTSVFCNYIANEYVTGAPAAIYDSFFVDGSQADDGNQVEANFFAASQPVGSSASWLASGLSAASHTIKVEHKVSAQTGHWRDRSLQCWGTPP